MQQNIYLSPIPTCLQAGQLHACNQIVLAIARDLYFDERVQDLYRIHSYIAMIRCTEKTKRSAGAQERSVFMLVIFVFTIKNNLDWLLFRSSSNCDRKAKYEVPYIKGQKGRICIIHKGEAQIKETCERGNYEISIHETMPFPFFPLIARHCIQGAHRRCGLEGAGGPGPLGGDGAGDLEAAGQAVHAGGRLRGRGGVAVEAGAGPHRAGAGGGLHLLQEAEEQPAGRRARDQVTCRGKKSFVHMSLKGQHHVPIRVIHKHKIVKYTNANTCFLN